MKNMQALEEVVLTDRRVILRVDLNVPLDGGRILDTYRLEAVAPTIHFLVNRGARVILISHLGRPDGKSDSALSLAPIYQALSKILKKPIKFLPELFGSETSTSLEQLETGEIAGMENLRFDKGEEANSRTFAKKLSQYGDIYVNDAFAVSHREAASVVAITEFLPSYAGLLLEREYRIIGNLIRHPAQPFVAIIGGAKIKDKLPAVRQLLTKADRVLVGGAIASTFLAANGVKVKKSMIEKEFLQEAKNILDNSKGKLILPTDYRWQGDKILDIGPETTALFCQYIKNAQTVFWNGNLGKSEDPAFAAGSDTVARALAADNSTRIIGGGNTIEVFRRLGLLGKVSFVSTGGGATLELIAGYRLPGLLALG